MHPGALAAGTTPHNITYGFEWSSCSLFQSIITEYAQKNWETQQESPKSTTHENNRTRGFCTRYRSANSLRGSDAQTPDARFVGKSPSLLHMLFGIAHRDADSGTCGQKFHHRQFCILTLSLHLSFQIILSYELPWPKVLRISCVYPTPVCLNRLSFLDFITVIILVQSKNYKAAHYVRGASRK